MVSEQDSSHYSKLLTAKFAKASAKIAKGSGATRNVNVDRFDVLHLLRARRRPGVECASVAAWYLQCCLIESSAYGSRSSRIPVRI